MKMVKIPAETASPLTIQTLGRFDIRINGESVAFSHNKLKFLFTYLAAEKNRPHSREILAEMLWPERAAGKAAVNLRKALSILGNNFNWDPDRPYLIIGRSSVQFNGSLKFDFDLEKLHNLDRLISSSASLAPHEIGLIEECVSGFGGNFLIDVPVKGSTELEQWLLEKQSAAEFSHIRLLHFLTTRYLDSCDYDRALLTAYDILKLDNLDEGAHRAAMKIHASIGNRNRAIEQFRECERILKEELQSSPETETVELAQRLLTGTLMQNQSINTEADIQISDSALPPRSSYFIGRGEEMATLSDMVRDPDCRLITIYGPGGIGKTQLALELARKCESNYSDGLVFVPLEFAEGLFHGVAARIGVRGLSESEFRMTLRRMIGTKSLLLILDGFEHLIPEAEKLSEILTLSPNLKLLTTSREPLKLSEEWKYPLKGLPYPTDHGSPIDDFDAVRLFTKSARRANIHFSVQKDQIPALIDLCRKFDGLPLALDLAGYEAGNASLRLPGSEENQNPIRIRSELKNIPERHRSLHHLIESTLSAFTRREIRKILALSIFEGGFTEASARAVFDMEHDLFRILWDRSIITQCAGKRFLLHEMIRTFLLESLSGKRRLEIALRKIHSRYYLSLLHSVSDPDSPDAKQLEIPTSLMSETENILCAWDHEQNSLIDGPKKQTPLISALLKSTILSKKRSRLLYQYATQTILITMMDAHMASDADVDNLIKAFAREKESGNIGNMRFLHIINGGGPTSAQRRRLKDVVEGFTPLNAVVFHNPSIFTRLIVSAMSLWYPTIRGFRYEELPSAFGYLELTEEEVKLVESVIAELSAKLETLT